MSDLIQKIPAETLVQILEFAALSTRSYATVSSDPYNLCLVSKKFNTWMTPILYRAFDFGDVRAHSTKLVTRPMQFLRSLISKPHLAGYVKSIDLTLLWYYAFRLTDLDSILAYEILRLDRQPYYGLTIPRANTYLKEGKIKTLFLFVVEQILMRTRNIQNLELNFSWGCDLQSLGFGWKGLAQMARLEDYIFPHIISACGGLTRLAWSDPGYRGQHHGQARLAGVLEGLQSHRGTLEMLELRILAYHVTHPSKFPDAVSFVEFERFRHLKIDTWCLPDGTILANLLPPQIETFHLTSIDLAASYCSMVNPMSELATVASNFPSLRRITVVSHVGQSNFQDSMLQENITSIRDTFEKHGVWFDYQYFY